MSTVLLVIIVTVVMIALTALYVAAELATVSARKAKIQQQAVAGNRFAIMLAPIIEDSHQLDTAIAASQLGITAASLVLGSYGQSTIAGELTPLLVGLGGEAVARSISTIVVLVALTTLSVVLGELVPKSIALRYPEQTALATVLPIRWSTILFRPLIVVFNGTAALILRALGVQAAGSHTHVHAPDEIELLVAESTKGGLLDRDERELLSNAFHVNELRAAQVMVPRTQLTAAPLATPVPELLALAARAGYSRIPLYRASIDVIAGIVHIRDLYRLYVAGTREVQSVLRQVPFVPASASATVVWNRLRQEGSYVAIVFDEYGGTAGMITVEDLIAEIFGDVEDEFDAEPLAMTTGPDGRVALPGDMALDEVNTTFGLRLPAAGVHTLGGLITDALGRAPRVDDVVTIGGVTLYVAATNGLAVTQVGIVPPAASADSAAPEAR
ncbi:MAG: hemolysin family protein [Chloroflexales bacterium]